MGIGMAYETPNDSRIAISPEDFDRIHHTLNGGVRSLTIIIFTCSLFYT